MTVQGKGGAIQVTGEVLGLRRARAVEPSYDETGQPGA